MKTGLGEEEAGNLNTVKYSIQETALSVPGIAEKRSLVSLRLN